MCRTRSTASLYTSRDNTRFSGLSYTSLLGERSRQLLFATGSASVRQQVHTVRERLSTIYTALYGGRPPQRRTSFADKLSSSNILYAHGYYYFNARTQFSFCTYCAILHQTRIIIHAVGCSIVRRSIIYYLYMCNPTASIHLEYPTVGRGYFFN